MVPDVLERDRFTERREALVAHSLVSRGIRSELVLAARLKRGGPADFEMEMRCRNRHLIEKKT